MVQPFGVLVKVFHFLLCPIGHGGYTEFEKGFKAMRSEKFGKVILDWAQIH
jgi:hypothetical protein